MPAHRSRGVAGRSAEQARGVRGLPRDTQHGALLRRAAAQASGPAIPGGRGPAPRGPVGAVGGGRGRGGRSRRAVPAQRRRATRWGPTLRALRHLPTRERVRGQEMVVHLGHASSRGVPAGGAPMLCLHVVLRARAAGARDDCLGQLAPLLGHAREPGLQGIRNIEFYTGPHTIQTF